MPVVSGIDLQERLAASGEDIPIVFLSGHAEFQSGVRAMKAGAVDFLAKPFTEAELLAAVAKALEKDRGARAARVLKQDALERLARLTPRERQVCDLVATGLLNKQIAAGLGAAEKTIKCHRGRVMEKLRSVRWPSSFDWWTSHGIPERRARCGIAQLPTDGAHGRGPGLSPGRPSLRCSPLRSRPDDGRDRAGRRFVDRRQRRRRPAPERWPRSRGSAGHRRCDRGRGDRRAPAQDAPPATADVSACRDLVEIAHLTRAGATREMGRLLAREIATPLTSALNNLGAARRLLLRDPPQLEGDLRRGGRGAVRGPERGGRAPPARLAVAGRDRRRRSRRPERGGARGRPAGRGGSQSGRGRRAGPAAADPRRSGRAPFRWCSSCS